MTYVHFLAEGEEEAYELPYVKREITRLLDLQLNEIPLEQLERLADRHRDKILIFMHNEDKFYLICSWNLDEATRTVFNYLKLSKETKIDYYEIHNHYRWGERNLIRQKGLLPTNIKSLLRLIKFCGEYGIATLELMCLGKIAELCSTMIS